MMTSLDLNAQEVCMFTTCYQWYDALHGNMYIGTVRELLKVHPFEVVEINTTNYPTLEVHYACLFSCRFYPKIYTQLFFESTSRNKTLRGGSK